MISGIKRKILILITTVLFALPLNFAYAQKVSFSQMYSGWSNGALIFSQKLKGLEGREITMTGYMAPPLTPTIHFFVLTEVPMSVCPFCSSDADWPDNIIVVKPKEPLVALPYDEPISVTGTLEIGSEIDEETGFVSQLRIAAYDVSTL